MYTFFYVHTSKVIYISDGKYQTTTKSSKHERIRTWDLLEVKLEKKEIVDTTKKLENGFIILRERAVVFLEHLTLPSATTFKTKADALRFIDDSKKLLRKVIIPVKKITPPKSNQIYNIVDKDGRPVFNKWFKTEDELLTYILLLSGYSQKIISFRNSTNLPNPEISALKLPGFLSDGEIPNLRKEDVLDKKIIYRKGDDYIQSKTDLYEWVSSKYELLDLGYTHGACVKDLYEQFTLEQIKTPKFILVHTPNNYQDLWKVIKESDVIKATLKDLDKTSHMKITNHGKTAISFDDIHSAEEVYHTMLPEITRIKGSIHMLEYKPNSIVYLKRKFVEKTLTECLVD
jgi:hypothetical protein